MKQLLVIFLVCVQAVCFGQEGLTYFGVQFKPIVPSNLFRAGSEELTQNDATYIVRQNMGYTFGAVIRHDFKNWLSIESGISFTKRNYTASVADGLTAFTDSVRLGLVGYEIPVLGLVYVQLDEQIFMDAGFGLSFDLFPSDVSNGNAQDFYFTGWRSRYFNTGLVANVGWEFRTKDNGSFYLGGSYHRPFTPILLAELSLENQTNNVRIAQMKLTGNYLTIDFRYFFPGEKKDKKEKLEIDKNELPSWMGGSKDGEGKKKKKK